MTARDVCLSPAEWENALVQLQLAKQLGLIDDASPEALEARRQAKNAENARLQAAATAHCRDVKEDGIYWYCVENGLI